MSDPVSVDRLGRGEAPSSSRSASGKGGGYAQILWSSLVIGGSSFIGMGIGIVRTKAMALLLGPAGFGLMGAFTTILDLAKSAAHLGINSSGVRQIAESAGSGDARRIALTAHALRRATFVLGIAGALLLALFAMPVSAATFGSDAQAGAIALLSIAVFLRLVSDGQSALLQGLRRVGDMARVTVASAIVGTLAAVVLVYALREQGIVPALLAMTAASTLATWWYVKKAAPAGPASFAASEVTDEVRALLRLGAAFLLSAMLTLGAAYLVRITLIRLEGLEAAGLFQAAWTVGGLYVTFVLQAMGADFYPRLVAAAQDNEHCNRLVNEQAQVSLLIACVGVLATLTLAPWAITILYRQDFVAASDVLRWVCLGMALRVLTWPLGYVLIAKGKQRLFVGADLAWTVVNIALTWWCVSQMGLIGAGVAFFLSYVFHFMVVYPLCRRLSGFRWSRSNRKLGLIFAGSIAVVHGSFYVMDSLYATILGLVVTSLVGLGALATLRRLVAADDSETPLPRSFGRLLGRR